MLVSVSDIVMFVRYIEKIVNKFTTWGQKTFHDFFSFKMPKRMSACKAFNL